MLSSYAFIFAVLVRSISALKPAVIQLTEPVDHAEGPVWDSRTQLLYFVDIHSGKLNSFNIKTEEHRFIKLNGELAVAIPSEVNSSHFIVGLNRSVVAIEWDGGNRLKSTKTLSTVDEDKPTNRFNDGKADKEGRLWFGTMGYENSKGVLDTNKGSLYFITKQNLAHPEAIISPVNISNGLAWNKANDRFYYIDTPTNQVKEYVYDNNSGRISEPKIVFDVNTFSQYITGHPDGMTIDADDNLWIALYDGGAVVKVDPRKKQLSQIVPIPAQYTTSVCWGGEKYDILFVTTSRYTLNAEDRKRQSAAGSVFAVKGLDAVGLPSFKANIVSKAERM
ncbi:hypothetical protein Trydic_g11150 [Trypoxylus dichotomus]